MIYSRHCITETTQGRLGSSVIQIKKQRDLQSLNFYQELINESRASCEIIHGMCFGLHTQGSFYVVAEEMNK